MSYNFNEYKNKIESRKDTVINMYSYLFNRTSIPEDKHYITLCAEQVEDDKLAEGSELKQLLNSKLISINQFYGIDINEETIKKNSVVKGANWICSDLLDYINNVIEEINPAIINLDSVYSCKRKISDLLSNIMLLLHDYKKSECMIVTNFAINNPYRSNHNIEALVESETVEYYNNLYNNRYFKEMIKCGWQQLKRHYIYSSTGKTLMSTYIYYLL
jgi:hypothetical protein